MSNVISSAIFCVRNVDKAENQGKVGRIAVAAGQGKKLTDYVIGLDNAVGKEARTAVTALKKLAETEKAFEIAGKAINFASEHINPLLCVSAGIDILSAEDKESALVTNTTALTTMFAAEKLMKEYLDEIPKLTPVKNALASAKKFVTTNKYTKDAAERLIKFAQKDKVKGKIPMIIHGVAFVAGSCLAYDAGEKFGKLLLGQPVKKESENKKTEEPKA